MSIRVFESRVCLTGSIWTEWATVSFSIVVVFCELAIKDIPVLDSIHRPIFYFKQDISETGSCIRPQV
jgi:hypothetical protein